VVEAQLGDSGYSSATGCSAAAVNALRQHARPAARSGLVALFAIRDDTFGPERRRPPTIWRLFAVRAHDHLVFVLDHRQASGSSLPGAHSCGR
jgi:hypothetical protein